MSVQIADFWKLAVASGALSLERCKELHAAFQKLRGASGPANANSLAEWLVAEEVITRYQALVFLMGRPGPFVFGDFRVFDRIETGRLAGLLRAVQMSNGQRVLLHVFKGRAAQDAAAWQEIVAQARVAARAKDEHLSQVHCLVEAASQKFAVLADLDGRAVAEQYAAARVSAADAARIVAQAAAGLAVLHHLGTVHGSLCPANLWLEPSGNVRLLQFPLLGEAGASGGQGMRTGAYCAPELAIPGRQPDGQSDIYSLGCVLYELLAGRPRAAAMTGTPPGGDEGVVASLETQAAVPRPLAEIVARMLDSDRQRRYPSAAAVAQVLAGVMREPAAASGAKPRPLQPILVRQPATPGAASVRPVPIRVPTPTAGGSPVGAVGQPAALDAAAADAFEKPFSFSLDDPAGSEVRKKGWKDNLPALSMIGSAAVVIVVLLVFLLRPNGSGSDAPVNSASDSRVADSSNPTAARDRAASKQPGTKSSDELSGDEPMAETKKSKQAVDKPKRNKLAVQLVDDDGESLWASPTDGKPLSLRYLPSGAGLFLALRPADLLANREGKKFIEALGPGGAWGKERLEAITGMPMTDVAQLTIGFYTPEPGPPKVAMVVRSSGELDEKALREKWGPTNPVESGEQKYFAAGEWAYFFPPDEHHHVLAIAGPAAMPEVMGEVIATRETTDTGITRGIRSDGKDTAVVTRDEPPDEADFNGPALGRQMEELLKSSDQDRQITLLAEPNALLMSGEAVLAGNLMRLHDSLVWFFGDDVKATAISFHFGDDFFAELKAIGANEKDPRMVTEHFQRRLDAVPDKVEAYTISLDQHPYSRAILFRFPSWVRLAKDMTRIAAEREQAVLRCYLPGYAGQNLALGVELALAERPGAAAVVVNPGPKKPASAADALKQKMSLSFDKETLERTLDLLSKEIDTEIVILGGDLQLEGITKNQSFALAERDKPAGEILRIVMKKANPDGKLVYVIRQRNPGGKEAIFITTRAAVAKRGDKLPPELEAEPQSKK